MTTQPTRARPAAAPASAEDEPFCRPDGVSDTLLVHGARERTPYKEVSEAIFLTSGYVYDSAEAAEAAGQALGPDMIYTRFRNPTTQAFEQRLLRIEGAEACQATASGMAAVTAMLLCQLSAGDRIVVPYAVFGACHWICTNLLPRFGIEVVRVDGSDLTAWAEALEKPTKLVFLETPANPTLEIIDLPTVAALARGAGAAVAVDNAFASPLCQKPLTLGADIVVYSTTKHIDGQGRCLGGAILGRKSFIDEVVSPFARATGPTMSPFNAWVMLKGLETLGLRVRHSVRTAALVAAELEGHPKLERVLYPGLPSHPQHALAKRQMASGGTLLSLEVAGGKAGAFRFLNALELVLRVNNLGDSRSLATHAGTTTHSKLTEEEKAAARISPGLVRLSVGLEEPEDLLTDLQRALAVV